MKALVVQEPGRLVLREIHVPVPGPHEALVRIRACGICSTTDRELIAGRQPYHKAYPALLGHEAVGEVVETGPKVRHFHMVELVTRPCAIWPGTSRDGLASAWGGFAEFGIVRDRLAMEEDGDTSMAYDYTALRQNVLPHGLSVQQGIAAIALAETMSWLHHMPPVGGKVVCVAGTGIAGLGIALWCKLAGARQVIVLGRRDERLAVARRLCADEIINVTSQDTRSVVVQLTNGHGVDFYAEAVGQRDQVNIGLRILAKGGTIGIYGAAEDQRYDLGWGNSGGHASVQLAPAEEHLCYGTVADLLRRGIVRAEDFLTHQWPLTEFADAFAAVDSGKVLKGLLTM
ncbi:MAG TPA: zinc-binding dehydrogenase [Candidatus Methylacidiphilales bacterium]|nr:zinc-binding dehydrogenase [Candidatus Methylacidiphilales bacterium]